MEPDDNRPFLLKWSRTWPDDRTKQDFTGLLAADPTMFARVYLLESNPDESVRCFWTVSASQRPGSRPASRSLAGIRAVTVSCSFFLVPTAPAAVALSETAAAEIRALATKGAATFAADPGK